MALHNVIPIADSGVYLFVYGTLRKSLPSPMSMLLAQEANFIAEGYLQAKLYDLGSYPGAVLSNDPINLVRGDVYLLPNAQALFERLDDYEECTHHYVPPHEYRRVLAEVTVSLEVKLSAWTYLYNRTTDNLLCIDSGDYVQFLNSYVPASGSKDEDL